MTFSRRELFAIGATATALSSAGLSACSPADMSNVDLPGRYFAAIALGRLVDANQWADEDVSLAIVSTVGIQRFQGANDVGEALFRLLHSEGFVMVGDDTKAAFGGMYWRPLGPWHCSDMLKGGAVNLGGCGDALDHPIFNVLVHANFEAEKVETILLLENRNLIVQLGAWPEPVEFAK